MVAGSSLFGRYETSQRWLYELSHHKHGILHTVIKEFDGDAEDALLLLVRMVLEPLMLVAELIESMMKGFSKDEKALSTSLVRYHLVLRDIRSVYTKKCEKDLRTPSRANSAKTTRAGRR
ncbi:Annexin repeat [Phytophthora cactorum]|nr:Annexin repeat [Phytophthora cactorum]